MEARLGLLLFTLCSGIVLAAAAGEADAEQQQENRSAVNRSLLRRMNRYRAAEINACLRYVPDVGCDTFACLKNLTCDVEDNLHEICEDYIYNAAKFDFHGKRFTKDFLKCCALGIKSRFSSSTRCSSLQRMLFYVQIKCYQKHNICLAAETNLEALVSMIDLHKVLFNWAYVEYVRGLFECGDKVITTIRNHLKAQLGPAFPVLRPLWQESCTRKSTTTGTGSEDINVGNQTIQGGN